MSRDIRVREADWKREAELIRGIRYEVFVEEQHIPIEVEFDDQDEGARHFLAVDAHGQALGTTRLLSSGQIGRMAVLRGHRRRGIGRMLLDAAVQAARARGAYRVFLHAQSQTVRFYAAAGFVRDGEPFMEAGIPHLPMAREFPIEFVAPESRPGTPLVRPQQADADAPLLADVEAGFRRLDGDAELRAVILDMARRARRLVRVYSQEFDAKLFDTPELVQAVSAFARRHHSTRFEVMIHDSLRIVRDGHGLVELRHRLPSSIEIRRAHDDQYETHFTYMLVDDTAYLMMPRYYEYAGYCNYHDPARVRRHNVHWDEQWGRAQPDPNLRILSL